MAFLTIIILLSVVIIAIRKYFSIDDLPKKQRKFVYDVVMTWVGFKGSTQDFFFRSLDRNRK